MIFLKEFLKFDHRGKLHKEQCRQIGKNILFDKKPISRAGTLPFSKVRNLNRHRARTFSGVIVLIQPTACLIEES
jgi:hypothetical protein